MEERYLSLMVISDPIAADHSCCILEDAGIPVVIQHLTTSDHSHIHRIPAAVQEDGIFDGTGYRLLVPMRLAQTAMRLLKLREPVLITPRRPDVAA